MRAVLIFGVLELRNYAVLSSLDGLCPGFISLGRSALIWFGREPVDRQLLVGGGQRLESVRGSKPGRHLGQVRFDFALRKPLSVNRRTLGIAIWGHIEQ